MPTAFWGGRFGFSELAKSGTLPKGSPILSRISLFSNINDFLISPDIEIFILLLFSEVKEEG